MNEKMTNSQLTAEEMKDLQNAITTELERKPPTIALIGVSGVGKSSTINTLFKTNFATSDTVACTKEFQSKDVLLKFTEGQTKDLSTKFRVIDAPCLGEDITHDPDYLSMYRNHLPQCDVILWILAAKNRAVALDQTYLKELKQFHKKIIFGLNQVDLIEPMNWNSKINLPSEEQIENMNIIVKDRRQKFQDIIGDDIKLIPYSAKMRYNLQELFTSIIISCPSERAWIFQSLKNFRYDDFIPAKIHNIIMDRKENLSSPSIKSNNSFISNLKTSIKNFKIFLNNLFSSNKQ